MYKYIISLFLLLPFTALAVNPLDSLNEAAGGTGLVSNKTPIQIITSIINTILYIVGAIVIVLMLRAGFKWMTSAGNTEAIKKSRETIINATIGLAIIFASYVIVNFVMLRLIEGIGVGGGTTPAAVPIPPAG